MPTDQAIRRLPIPEVMGMFDGTVLTIEFIRGFELFNTRPYHNYENWSDGYRIKTHNGIVVQAEDLDDALELLRQKLAAVQHDAPTA